MYTIILIGIGGFIGAILRYTIGGWVQDNFVSFPFGTLAVNILGSFFLGLVMYLSEYQGIFNEETRVFLTIGILGAFTTLSTFSYESFRLLDNSNIMLLVINIVATVVLSIFAVYLGKTVALSLTSGLWRGIG
ncbi:fluoride efflux transporter CrcB [Methanolobus halotolerans]|uniref:Fluoride-specific ion channel FluC n=1 Tax=Methanolobus halotolerans TaxID=2052935 RepID=A0A4E0PV07_9EURY|nr:fluoride efflux transporter CrcB [Methanolobus halotolerans]TGC07425.1 fluoride efflux transporter CrcB [Methanolobus halotolerans]